MALFSNQARATYTGGTVLSNLVTGNYSDGITMTKTAVTDSYEADGTVTYTINLINSSQTEYTNLTLTDDLGAFPFGDQTVTPLTYEGGAIAYSVDGVPQPAPTVIAGPPMTVEGLSIPAGANATLVYEARVNEFAPLADGASIRNTASLNGAGLTAPVTASAVVNAAAGPELTIEKTASSTEISPGDTVTYTFTLYNTGNQPIDQAQNLIVTDPLAPGLTDPTVTIEGVPSTRNTDYTYANNVFATVPGRVTVPAATYRRDPTSGRYTVVPGTSVVTITGTVN